MQSNCRKLVVTGISAVDNDIACRFLREELSRCGWDAIIITGVAYLLRVAHIAKLRYPVLAAQVSLEDEILGGALHFKPSDKKVIICDRGAMDSAAYMSRVNFNNLLRRHKLDRVKLRDKRYDAVFHLTNAFGISGLDKKIQDSWLGHPHFRVVRDCLSLWEAVKKALGIPLPIETERKFLVNDGISLRRIPVPCQKINIQQAYLQRKTRLRRRGQDGWGEVYYLTQKSPTASSRSRVEIEKQITADEFWAKLKHRDADRDILHKSRTYFLWKNQYFELDIFTEPARLRGLTLLEIELTEENDKVEIPDWLGKVTEVTEDPKYSNKALAKRPT